MKLGIDIRTIADEHMTGIGRYTASMVQALDAKPDADVALIPWYSGSPSVSDRIDSRMKGLRAHVVHTAIRTRTVAASALFFHGKILQRAFLGADYWWLPNINFLPARRMPPYTLTVHDLSYLHMPSWYSVKRRLWHRFVRIRQLLHNADALITVSESTREELLWYFPNLKNIPLRVIYPGFEESARARETLQSVGQTSIPASYILYIGTVEPRKNILSVLKAFEQLQPLYPDLRLLIAGAPGWSSRWLVSALKKNPRVLLAGYIIDLERDELMQRARLVVWPSLYEGYGFPPVEALQMGTPVITSYRTSMPEILGPNALYVNPYNYIELAAVCREVLAAPKERTSTALHHRHTTWSDAATELLSFLKLRYANRN